MEFSSIKGGDEDVEVKKNTKCVSEVTAVAMGDQFGLLIEWGSECLLISFIAC